MLNLMSPEAKMKSITFTDNGQYGITSVKCSLTNGKISPLFAKAVCRKKSQQTINIHPYTAIKAVAAAQY